MMLSAAHPSHASRFAWPVLLPAAHTDRCVGEMGAAQSVLVASYSVGIDSSPAGGRGGLLDAVIRDVRELLQGNYDIVFLQGLGDQNVGAHRQVQEPRACRAAPAARAVPAAQAARVAPAS